MATPFLLRDSWPLVLDIMVISVKFSHSSHFRSLIPKMPMFTLALSCLITPSLPWFMDLTFQVPMQYCSVQHWTLLPSSITSTTGCCFCWLYRASPSLAAKNIINLILISVLALWWCPCIESSLVLLEDGVCYDQCIFLAKLVFALIDSIFLTSRLYKCEPLRGHCSPYLNISNLYLKELSFRTDEILLVFNSLITQNTKDIGKFLQRWHRFHHWCTDQPFPKPGK